MKSTSTTTASTFNSKNSFSSTKSIIDIGTQPEIVMLRNNEITQFETPMDARESSIDTDNTTVATATATATSTDNTPSIAPPFFYAAAATKKTQAGNPPGQSTLVAPIQTIVPKPAPAPVPVYTPFSPQPDISSREKGGSHKYSYLDALSQTSTNDEPIAGKRSGSADYLSALASSSSATSVSQSMQSEEINAASDSNTKESHGDVHHNDNDNPTSTTIPDITSSSSSTSQISTNTEIDDIGIDIDISLPIEEQVANLSPEEAAKLVSEFMANSQQETMKELQALEDAMNAEIEALRKELDGISVTDADATREEEKERDTTMPASTDVVLPMEDVDPERLMADVSGMSAKELMLQVEEYEMKELQALEDAMNAEIGRESDGNSVANAVREEEKETDTAMPASTDVALPMEEVDLERLMADMSEMPAEELLLQIEEYEKMIEKIMELEGVEISEGDLLGEASTGADGLVSVEGGALDSGNASVGKIGELDEIQIQEEENTIVGESLLVEDVLNLDTSQDENSRECEEMVVGEGGENDLSFEDDSSISRNIHVVENDIKHDATIHDNESSSDDLILGEDDESDASRNGDLITSEDAFLGEVGEHDILQEVIMSEEMLVGENQEEEANADVDSQGSSNDDVTSSVPTPSIASIPNFGSIPSISNDEVIAHVLSLSAEEAANAVINYVVKREEEKNYALKRLEKQKNREIQSLKQQIILASSLRPGQDYEYYVDLLTKRVDLLQDFMARYIVDAQEEKRKAVREAEVYMEEKYSIIFNSVFLESCWDLDVGIGQDNGIFQESNEIGPPSEASNAEAVNEDFENARMDSDFNSEAGISTEAGIITSDPNIDFESQQHDKQNSSVNESNGLLRRLHSEEKRKAVAESNELHQRALLQTRLHLERLDREKKRPMIAESKHEPAERRDANKPSEAITSEEKEDALNFEKMATRVKQAAEEEKKARDSLQAELFARALQEEARNAELDYLLEEARIAKETQVLEAEILAEENSIAEIKKLVEIAQLEEDAKLEESLEGLRVEGEKMAAEEAERVSVGSEHVTIEQNGMQEKAKENELAEEAELFSIKDKERTKERNQRELLHTRFRLQHLDSVNTRAKVIESNQRSLLISQLRNERLRMGTEELDRDRLQAEENDGLRIEDEESFAGESSAVASIDDLVGKVVAQRNLYRFSPTQSPIQSPFTIEKRQCFTVQQDQSMQPIGGQSFIFRGFAEELDGVEEGQPIIKADATRNFVAVGPALYSVNGLADGEASQDSNGAEWECSCALALYSMTNPDIIEGKGMQLGSGSGVAGILSVVGAGLTAGPPGLKEIQRQPADRKNKTPPVPESLSKILLTESQGNLLDKCVENLRASAFPIGKVELGLLDWEQNIPMSMGDMYDFIVGCDCAFGLPSVTPLARTVALTLKSSPRDKAEQSKQQIRGKFLHVGPGNIESNFDLENGLVNLHKMVSNMEEIVLERLELVPLVFDSLDEAGVQLKDETDKNVGGMVEFQNIESSIYSALIAHHNEDYDGSNGDAIFEKGDLI